MSSLLLYSTCVIGAVGLYLVLRPGPRSTRGAGALLGLGTLVYLGLRVGLAAGVGAGATSESPILFGLFAVIALCGAVRMITHPRPVYAALYFVLVILSSAALFLMLQAEFIAFALVIVYAGAILITYMFVLMLAHQASEDDVNASAEYDRIPREPAAAVIVGLVLVAATADVMVGPASAASPQGLPRAVLADAGDGLRGARAAWSALEQMPLARRRAVAAVEPDFQTIHTDDAGRAIWVEADGRARVAVTLADGSERVVELEEYAKPTNTEEVGVALVARFPVSLELAGVILTMAMFGAVVLARRQIELGEDRRREAHGIGRLTVDEPESDDEDGRP